MKWSAALFCGMALALPVAAQEEEVPKEPAPAQAETASAPAEAKAQKPKNETGEPALHRWGGWILSVAAWDPTLVGADEEVATTFQNGVGTPLMQGSSGRIKETVEAAYLLPHGAGSIVAHYDSMRDDDSLRNFTPGFFNFAESRTYPAFAGAFDDGFSDGVSSSTLRKTREFRLEYQRPAFETKWARGVWGVGYRNVSHSRALGITYPAIAPNLPPLIPPIVDGTSDPLRLAPLTDSVSQESSYSGHGVGASIRVDFPITPRVSIVSGLAFGLIRGDAKSEYLSSTAYYYLLTPDNRITLEQLYAIAAGEVLDEDGNSLLPSVDQAYVQVGARVNGSSQMAETVDVYVGVEVHVWKGLKVFANLRELYYANVGEYVVVRPGPQNVRTELNAGYEGYAVGVSWKF